MTLSLTRILKVCLFCAVMLSSPATTGYSQTSIDALTKEALKQINNESTDTSRVIFGKGSLNNNPVIQYDIGEQYSTARGVARDEQEAAKWYRKSANQGYAPAKYELARMYASGSGGLSEDETEAIRLIKEAAAQNYSKARLALAYYSFIKIFPKGYETFAAAIFTILAVTMIVGAWLLVNAMWIMFFVELAAGFAPSFLTAFKAALASSMFYPAYCILGSSKPELGLAFISILAMISAVMLGKIIKHPQTGSIGRQRGALIFAGAILGQMILSLFVSIR